MRTRRLIGVAAAALVLVTGTAATSGTASAATRGAAPAAATRLATHVHPHPRLALLRAATAKYHSIAVAERHGYAKFVDVNGVACIAMPGMGAMGVHYVNGDRVNDPSIKPFKPEALVYAPGPRGRLQLAAVEYIVVKSAWDATHKSPPRLFGHAFNFTDAPNRYGLPPFYSLHVWVWKHNPAGTFQMWNPDVHCHCGG